LRRAVPSFTVEVRRRPRLATSNPDEPLSEARSPGAGFNRASHRVATEALEAEKPDPPPIVEAASCPKGRILPSLVPDESLRWTLRDAAPTPAGSAPPPRVPKRPPARRLKDKDQASQLPRNSRVSSGDNALVAVRASTKRGQASGAQSEEGAALSRRVTAAMQTQVAGNSGDLVLSAKAKRRSPIAISRDDVRVAKPLPNGQRSAIGTDSPATPSSVVDDRSPLGRKRTIMTRYVFGDELKPGERWKRRLLAMR
jgi:hypothetical protein